MPKEKKSSDVSRAEAGEEKKEKNKNQDAPLEVVEKVEEEKTEETQIDLLKERLVKSEEQTKELEDRLLRLAAEFDNYKKRMAKEFGYLIKNANENLILQLLDTLDNFQRALDSAPAKGGISNKTSDDYESFHKGVELIHNHMKEILTKEGLKEIEALGKPFDPNFHEAVTQAESDKHDEGIIIDEISKGYMLNDRLLRASKVVVSKGKPKDQEKETA
ncbi:MAG: nucleotide exchange factor GrpE [candidate division Zixibacteria bacterium]|nr:nucleotide exchange factor GrpE [candidate division Zixibacteria bacterium]